MNEEVRDELVKAVAVHPLGEVDGDDVGEDVHVIDPSPREDAPRDLVGESITTRVLCPGVGVMAHARQAAVGLESHDARSRSLLFDNGDWLTHRQGSVPVVSAKHHRALTTLRTMSVDPPGAATRAPVPWRTIAAGIAMVCATVAVLLILREISRIIVWLLVAGFLAVVLSPAVDQAQRHLRLPRVPATLIVFLVVIGVLGGMVYTFVRPVVDQVDTFLDSLPAAVEDAQEGRGAIGELVERYNLSTVIAENRDKIESQWTDAGAPALKVLRSIFNTVLSAITVVVLAFLLVVRGPQLGSATLALVAQGRREQVRNMGADAARAISGYMFGNLVISVIAGTVTYVLLLLLGVPYAAVIALFVAFADLIPMVGATLGAIPTIGLSFLHGTSAGVIALIFYVAYQQFENHVLQVTIMSKAVDVSPLTVMVSVLVGVELFGLVGALLAVPAAGTIQVVVGDLYRELRKDRELDEN